MDDFESLTTDVQTLRALLSQLADQLIVASEDLKNSGIPLSETLCNDLAATRRSFEDICDRYRNLSHRLDTVVTSTVALRSLEHIEELLCRAKEDTDRRRTEERLQKSLTKIELVIQFEHSEATRNELLEPVRQEAIRLRNSITSTERYENFPDVDLLLTGEHPLAALVRLVTENRSLDESELESLETSVEKAFGRKLAMAAVAGRLRLKSKSSVVDRVTETADEHAPSNIAEPIKEPLSDIEEPVATQVAIDHSKALSMGTVSFLHDSFETGASNSNPSPETEVLAPKATSIEASSAHAELKDESGSISDPVVVNESAPLDILQRTNTPCPTEIPQELTSYENFCQKHYLTCRDQVEPAWWVDHPTEFLTQSTSYLKECLGQSRLSHAWLACRAIERLGKKPIVSSQDLMSAESIRKCSNSTSRALDSSRSVRLRTLLLENERETDSRLSLVLESICPAVSAPLSDQEVDRLTEYSRFQSAELREFVRMSLKLHSRGLSSIELLRARLKQEKPETSEEIQKKLTEKRKEFQTEVVRLWSGAGGGLKLTHCRKAWEAFIEKIKGIVTQLYPPAEGGRESWDTTEAERQLEGIESIYQKIADRADVKYQERRKSNHAAGSIQRFALEVNSLMRDFQRTLARAASGNEQFVPLAETRQLIETLPSSDQIERLCGELLRTIFGTTQSLSNETNVLVLAEPDFIACPELLGLIPADAFNLQDKSERHGSQLIISVEEITEPVLAAACLLESNMPTDGIGRDVLESQLRNRGRWDLLCRIPAFAHPEDGWVRQSRKIGWEEVGKLMTDIHRHWRHLTDMAEPLAIQLGIVYHEAERIRDRMLNEDSGLYLLQAWLKRLRDFAVSSAQHAEAHLKLTVESIPEELIKESALSRINAHQYADALLILGRQELPNVKEVRETVWRDKAKVVFPDPRRCLASAGLQLSGLKDVKELLDDWRKGYVGGSQTADRPLRTRFARLMFASRDSDRTDVPRPRGNNELVDSFRVDCHAILDWFARQNLNPSFMPQLRRYSQVVILTPLEPVSSSLLVQRLRSQVANETANSGLCVVLMPQMSEQVREEILYEFRKDGLSAGIVDDLDLCRLLNPGGRQLNLIVAMLEMVFEQQKPAAFSPFERHDGQHVRMEMFVGRQEQARELAWTSNYTRLFSGRKLGKSALLSSVKQTYNQTQLPSGNNLRVLYVSGVSAGEEAEMVRRVLDAMRVDLDFVPEAEVAEESPASGSPGKYLVRAFKQYVTQRPGESVLVLFDEADLFVERQVFDYDQRREECLSFLIRSQIESHQDSRGLPRVRFLFSGYRVTHLNAGAWAGAWGDVLRLQPLSPEDASRLVRGPLERLGIDAADVAPSIAWRCGYQPAIIIAFCRQLLQEFRPHRNNLTAEDVASVFESPVVQDEIRAVIESNFQGNTLGRIVFLATIFEFYERRPGEGIQELPEKLFDRFRQIDPDVEWLQSADDQSSLSRIAVQVQDFVRRQLLRIERGSEGVITFFLSFPHHLPILMEELTLEPEARIRREIEAFRRGQRGSTRETGQIQSLLPGPDLQALRNTISGPADPDLPIRSGVLVTSWSGAAPLSLIAPTAQPNACPKDSSQLGELVQGSQVLFDVPGNMLNQVLNTLQENTIPPLLVGGADLLRSVLQREREEGELFELRSLGRISPAQLEWWFSRMRALELDPSAFERLMSRTSGIPFLIRLADTLLMDRFSGGANVSEAELDEILELFDQRLPDEVQTLQRGIPALQLLPRELEILQMVAAAGPDATPGAPLSEHLTNLWELYSDTCPFKSLSPDDYVAMSVVQRLGFVPVNPNTLDGIPLDRFVGLPANDALVRIAVALKALQCN